jgi:hypothetical protein
MMRSSCGGIGIEYVSAAEEVAAAKEHINMIDNISFFIDLTSFSNRLVNCPYLRQLTREHVYRLSFEPERGKVAWRRGWMSKRPAVDSLSLTSVDRDTLTETSTV